MGKFLGYDPNNCIILMIHIIPEALKIVFCPTDTI